jgi:predicted O-linked N-acetylglucosamine transferase (SPINDLY family)
MNLQAIAPEVWQVWQANNFYRAGTMLASIQAQHPDEPTYSFYLGLAYLLQGKPERALDTWQATRQLSTGDNTLLEVLQAEATRLEQQQEWLLAERVRRQLQTLDPSNVNNLLYLMLLWLRQETFTDDSLDALKLADALGAVQPGTVDQNLLRATMQALLHVNPTLPQLPQILRAALPMLSAQQAPQPWLDILRPRIKELAELNQSGLACDYARLCLALDEENLDLIRQATRLFAAQRFYQEAIALADKLSAKSQSLLDQMLSNVTHLHSSLRMGRSWAEIEMMMQTQLALLDQLRSQPPDSELWANPIDLLERGILANTLFLCPYFSDRPADHHALRQRVGALLASSLKTFLANAPEPYQPFPHHPRQPREKTSRPIRKLRVGYIGQYLRQHSVGWIARWLFAYHDHDQFEIYTYFNQQAQLQSFSQEWFAAKSDGWHTMTGDVVEIARTIQADEIDILVDVDSLTSNETYGVMALKPAPVQVSWLGWDAPGLSTVDYFIADPYVLPDHAQDYYTEKIWRLPRTYVAVQGFEVDFPTRRREDLDIPVDAIVYLSNQTAIKRHPEMVRVQMQVLRQVPNSYFLIKNWGDLESMQAFFGDIAEAEGVSRDRLRFLPLAPQESLYRGNLSLADVVLDSYPYGGATTTLETLWLGLPLVTKVGEQFQARNSYSMMLNAGITEGIAWNDDEYIDWAVKFGTSEELRKQVFTKLVRSRQTAPLWNAKQFTRDMETAYQQMWRLYQE